MNKHRKSYNQSYNQTGRSKVTTTIVLLLVWLAVGAILINEQRIFDYIKLRGYNPPQAVVDLARQDTLTTAAEHLFYLNKPGVLSTVSSFRQYCPENEDTIVLGCYHSSQSGIYVYNVPDPALAGVQQVTAAHETLHAAYDRLGSGEKKSVNRMLQDYYDHGLTDAQVKSEIAIYMKTEPTAVVDEMHSIFGTEVGSLPAPLEAYYRRYFSDRSKVIAYRDQYQAQFTQRQSTIAEDDKQLTNIKSTIDVQQSSIDARLTQISSDRSRINGFLRNNQTAEYNAAVPGFNAEIDGYNVAVQSLRSKIDSYNQLVAARNLVAGQLSILDKALDTRTTTTVPQ